MEKTINRDKIVTAVYCKKVDAKQVQTEICSYYENLFTFGIGKQEFEIIKAARIDFLLSRPIHLTAKLLRDIGDKYLAENNAYADEEIQQEFVRIEKDKITRFDPKQVKNQIKVIKSLNYKQFNNYLQFFKGCELVFRKKD